MANVQMINTVTHRDLCCRSEYTDDLGYGVGAIMVLPAEIAEAQREYPIFFRKHSSTGVFFPNVMLGFQMNENLFLDGKGSWNARYVPLSAAKGPFMIGFQEDEASKASVPVVCVDLDDARIGEAVGDRLFDAAGAQTPYFEQVSRSLLALHEGSQAIQTMVQSFLAADLLEPVTLNIQFKNGETVNFSGAYTIPEEKLQELSADQLHQLNQKGLLGLAHMIAASINNVSRLIDMKNKISS